MKELSKEDISKIFWQILEYWWFDGANEAYYDDEEDKLLNTTLDYKAREEFSNKTYDELEFEGDEIADIEETFGIKVDNYEQKTMAQIIDFLYANRSDIELGDNVDTDLKWSVV